MKNFLFWWVGILSFPIRLFLVFYELKGSHVVGKELFLSWGEWSDWRYNTIERSISRKKIWWSSWSLLLKIWRTYISTAYWNLSNALCVLYSVVSYCYNGHSCCWNFCALDINHLWSYCCRGVSLLSGRCNFCKYLALFISFLWIENFSFGLLRAFTLLSKNDDYWGTDLGF